MTAPGTSGASSSAVSPEIRAALDAQKDAILAAVNTQIQGLQSNLLAAQSDLASQIASEVQPDSSIFKKKGNEQQFKFNQKVLKTSVAANRQKIIKLADKSDFGWATVQEYVADDLADNDVDASKIKKAEKRAAAKVKSLQEKKRKSNPKPSFSVPSSSIGASKFGDGAGSLSPSVNYFRPQGRSSSNFNRSFDMCYRCGRRGHWANYCPLRDKAVSTVSRS